MVSKAEKVQKFKLTNDYGVNFYYRTVRGVDLPVLWYQVGNRVRSVTLDPLKKSFRDTYSVRFSDVDTSYFEGLFADKIVEKIIEKNV